MTPVAYELASDTNHGLGVVTIIVAARLMVSHKAEGEELHGIYHFVKEVTSPSPGCRS